jgi:hypothetical protein
LHHHFVQAAKKADTPKGVGRDFRVVGSLEIVHTAHAVIMRHSGKGFLLRLFGDHRLGRDKQTGDGRGVL